MEEELEDEDAEGDTVEEQDRSQDRDPHFVPACTSDMHMDMSDELCYARMPVRRTFCAILRNRKAHGHVTRAHVCKFRGEREIFALHHREVDSA